MNITTEPQPEENCTVPLAPPTQWKQAKRTKLQRDAAKDRSLGMWDTINKARENYQKNINDLVEEYNRQVTITLSLVSCQTRLQDA